MSDEHRAILLRGADAWNEWRRSQSRLEPNFAREDLSGLDLRSADLFEAALTQADLRDTRLQHADLTRATLSAARLSRAELSYARLQDAKLTQAEFEQARLAHADLARADLSFTRMREADLRSAKVVRAWLFRADLARADLRDADLRFAELDEADLTGAKLNGANLEGASLRRTILKKADISGCRVYGIAVWDVELDDETRQADLVVTRADQPVVTVDNLEVAQFVYLLLNNQRIRDVIDSITGKVVLILGRFTPERKAVLDGLREELRNQGYLPILFDFDVPAERDVTETVTLLARMARFIVADLTDPSSIPKELEAVVPSLAVPVLPILAGGDRPYSMFRDYWKYDRVLPVVRYESIEALIAGLPSEVVRPAEAKHEELRARRLAALS